MELIIDTREQTPLFTNLKTKSQKLEVADYTTDSLLNIVHAERKTPADLYQTITSGHQRFKRQILRAIEYNIYFEVFIDCPEDAFYKKKWHFRPGQLKVRGSTLAKIVSSLKKKYGLKFNWAENTMQMEEQIRAYLEEWAYVLYEMNEAKPELRVREEKQRDD